MRRAQDRCQPLAGIDAVLQRNDNSFATDQRADMVSCGLDIPELHAEQHQIDGAERGGIARCAPRATKTTSCPAPASDAPSGAPMPPAPTMAMRMRCLLSLRAGA